MVRCICCVVTGISLRCGHDCVTGVELWFSPVFMGCFAREVVCGYGNFEDWFGWVVGGFLLALVSLLFCGGCV